MIIHTEYQQGSPEWFAARAGIPTASEFDQLVTPDFAIRTGQMPRSYLARKVAEAWQGGASPGYTGYDMDQGTLLESEAIPFFELEYGIEVRRVPFITTDDGLVGCSPDGIIDQDGEPYAGLEIKCPEPHTHARYLLDGVLPKEYGPQVHGGMFVTGLKHWHFLSYRRHFPPLLVTIARDEKIQAAIAKAIAAFTDELTEAWNILVDRNGGPPRGLTPMPAPEPEFSEEPA